MSNEYGNTYILIAGNRWNNWQGKNIASEVIHTLYSFKSPHHDWLIPNLAYANSNFIVLLVRLGVLLYFPHGGVFTVFGKFCKELKYMKESNWVGAGK